MDLNPKAIDGLQNHIAKLLKVTALLNGSETWASTKIDKSRIHTSERAFLKTNVLPVWIG